MRCSPTPVDKPAACSEGRYRSEPNLRWSSLPDWLQTGCTNRGPCALQGSQRDLLTCSQFQGRVSGGGLTAPAGIFTEGVETRNPAVARAGVAVRP